MKVTENMVDSLFQKEKALNALLEKAYSASKERGSFISEAEIPVIESEILDHFKDPRAKEYAKELYLSKIHELRRLYVVTTKASGPQSDPLMQTLQLAIAHVVERFSLRMARVSKMLLIGETMPSMLVDDIQPLTTAALRGLDDEVALLEEAYTKIQNLKN